MRIHDRLLERMTLRVQAEADEQVADHRRDGGQPNLVIPVFAEGLPLARKNAASHRAVGAVQ